MSDKPRNNLTPAGVQLVAGGILAATLLYAALGAALVHLQIVQIQILPEDLSRVLGILFVCVGASTVVASFPLRKMLERRLLSATSTLSDRFRVVIVAMSLADAAGVMGFVYAILSGTLGYALLLWSCALVGCILHFPTRFWLEQTGSMNQKL